MEDKRQTGLTPAASGTALVRSVGRAGLIARGRREFVDAAANPDYAAAAAQYARGDFIHAVYGFRRAAEAGHAESQYMLSTLLEEGQGVQQDRDEAALWERKAAEQGHAYAQANLSFRHYEAGELAEAFAWCMRAAHNRLAWAQFHLGLMFRKGEGVEPNDAEAARWYRLAADQGFAAAQAKLADLYTFGKGVPRDLAQAAEWFSRAAESGDAEAQYQLGLLYATGQGVEPDYMLSRQWIRQAAQQGHAFAMEELKRREYRDP